jgi:hypothetical protein
MYQALALDEPDTTLQLLNILDLAIDEARLVRKIMDMNSQAGNIESTIGPSTRTRCLREEVKILESELSYIRNQKSLVNDQQSVL